MIIITNIYNEIFKLNFCYNNKQKTFHYCNALKSLHVRLLVANCADERRQTDRQTEK